MRIQVVEQSSLGKYGESENSTANMALSDQLIDRANALVPGIFGALVSEMGDTRGIPAQVVYDPPIANAILTFATMLSRYEERARGRIRVEVDRDIRTMSLVLSFSAEIDAYDRSFVAVPVIPPTPAVRVDRDPSFPVPERRHESRYRFRWSEPAQPVTTATSQSGQQDTPKRRLSFRSSVK